VTDLELSLLLLAVPSGGAARRWVLTQGRRAAHEAGGPLWLARGVLCLPGVRGAPVSRRSGIPPVGQEWAYASRCREWSRSRTRGPWRLVGVRRRHGKTALCAVNPLPFRAPRKRSSRRSVRQRLRATSWVGRHQRERRLL